MCSRSFIIALLLATVLASHAATIQWTGGAGNSLWSFANNWNGNAVPTANDDVVVTAIGGAAISVSQPAFAKSLTIGGGVYSQSVTLLSSLSVGIGGITISTKSTLQLSGNNDLPLSSVGNVTALAGASIIYNSGEITGPGQYVVTKDAAIIFSGAALKLIFATSLYLYGTATIQPTTIQLSSNATIENYGTLLGTQTITMFTNDNSATALRVHQGSKFSYQGGGDSISFTFQLSTFFYENVEIVSGYFVINEAFYSSGIISLGDSTHIDVGAGAAEKVFGSVVGSGNFFVYGITKITGQLSVSWAYVADSGSILLLSSSSSYQLTVNGLLTLNSRSVVFSASVASINAGVIAGSGELRVAGTLQLDKSTNGNTNIFVSATVTINGAAAVINPITILLSGNGTINVVGKLLLTAAIRFLRQTGTPVIVNNGVITVQLSNTSSFYSNVDIRGSGTLELVSASIITFEADTVSAGQIIIQANVDVSTAVINAGYISGSGIFNLTAAPSPSSNVGRISVRYFGVRDGNVIATSVNVGLLEVHNGQLFVPAGSNNNATYFHFFGGSIHGGNSTSSGQRAVIKSSATVLYGIAQTLDDIVVNTDRLQLRAAVTESTLITQNGAQINVGYSSEEDNLFQIFWNSLLNK